MDAACMLRISNEVLDSSYGASFAAFLQRNTRALVAAENVEQLEQTLRSFIHPFALHLGQLNIDFVDDNGMPFDEKYDDVLIVLISRNARIH